MKQLSVRGFDKEVERRLRMLAQSEGISLNRAALRLMRKGVGLEESGGGPQWVGSALDRFVGTWSKADERKCLKAVKDYFGRIDGGMWA